MLTACLLLLDLCIDHVTSSSGLYKIGITIPALQTVLREAKSGLRRLVYIDSSAENKYLHLGCSQSSGWRSWREEDALSGP